MGRKKVKNIETESVRKRGEREDTLVLKGFESSKRESKKKRKRERERERLKGGESDERYTCKSKIKKRE